MSIDPIQVLLIEDSAADIRLTQEALRDGKVINDLHVLRDGEAALDYVFQRGEFEGATRPDLIILDLNLPKVDGKEVLSQLKGEESLRSIPVAVLTSSSADRDIVESYDLGANCYLTKPVDLEQFLKVVNQIEDFWLGIVRLPSLNRASG